VTVKELGIGTDNGVRILYKLGKDS